MTYPWKDLSPKDPFVVQQTNVITDIDKKVVTFLYQPIIGPQAYSLYMTLLSEINAGAYRSDELLHSDLLSTLGIGIQELYQARVRLEGIGLLQTYLVREGEKRYVYQPCPPLSSAGFFREDLLRLLLFEQVGKRKFEALRSRFTISHPEQKDLEDITKSFLSVYRLSASSYRESEVAIVNEGEQLVESGEGQAPEIEESLFNFTFLQELLQREFFSPESLTADVKHTIQVLHQVYGIDEMEMSQHLLRATNLESGKIDTKELTEYVTESRQKGHTRPGKRITDQVEVVQQKTADEQTQRKAQLAKGGFTEQEIALILMSEKRTPYSFMKNLKKQKNGTVTQSERELLTYLADEHKLSSAVLNILIYYVLIVQNNTRMTKEFTEAIADNWNQSNVQTPEQAIEKTKQFVGQVKAAAEKRNENRSNRYYGKNVVRKVEKLPEWAKDDYEPQKEEMMSEEMQRKFDERLKKIRERARGGEE